MAAALDAPGRRDYPSSMGRPPRRLLAFALAVPCQAGASSLGDGSILAAEPGSRRPRRLPPGELAAEPEPARRRRPPIAVYMIDYAGLPWSAGEEISYVGERLGGLGELNPRARVERSYLMGAASPGQLFENLRLVQRRGRVAVLVLSSHMAPGRVRLGHPAADLGPLDFPRSALRDLWPGALLIFTGCEFGKGRAGRYAMESLGWRLLRRGGGSVLAFSEKSRFAECRLGSWPSAGELETSYKRFRVFPEASQAGGKWAGRHFSGGAASMESSADEEDLVPADPGYFERLEACLKGESYGWAACMGSASPPTRPPPRGSPGR